MIRQPHGQLLIITTAGDSRESPCYDMRNSLSEHMAEDKGNFLDGRFVVIYCADSPDWDKQESPDLELKKANPAFSLEVVRDRILPQFYGLEDKPERLGQFSSSTT